MLKIFNTKLKAFCSRFRWPPASRRRRSLKKTTTTAAARSSFSSSSTSSSSSSSRISNNPTAPAAIHPTHVEPSSIRVATFNVALFSMAPAVPVPHHNSSTQEDDDEDFINKPTHHYNYLRRGSKSMRDRRPKGILKNPIITTSAKSSRLRRVSINLPDNEISLKRRCACVSAHNEEEEDPITTATATATAKCVICRGKAPFVLRSNSISSCTATSSSSLGLGLGADQCGSRRSIFEVLKELNADVLALQDVKAEEEKNMKPLSDLAHALGMNYVFAESWAPQYGNAILSKWPIKRWKVQKVCDDTDFRNVLKATIDVPQAGEVNILCTHLDHLDENWRMKQINAIIQSIDVPHILAGDLNSLDQTDYSEDRWSDIVKYYEETRKPTPKVEVMKYLKSKLYTDAKDSAGECESIVMIAKGQSVQGTCKYGTRVDYILSSLEAPYKFVPGSYSVLSSKGTSDHHIVKVDLIKQVEMKRKARQKQKRRRTVLVKITHSSSPAPKGIWKLHS